MGCFPCVSRRGKTFHVKILLLDKQELIEEVKHERTTGQDLLDSVFAHLNLIETAYFGLRYQDSSNQTVRENAGRGDGYSSSTLGTQCVGIQGVFAMRYCDTGQVH